MIASNASRKSRNDLYRGVAVFLGLAIVNASQPLTNELLFVVAALILDAAFALFTKGFGAVPDRFFETCSVYPM